MARYVYTEAFPEPGTPLPAGLDERFKRLGFDPGWPIYCHTDLYASVRLDHVRRALFESMYSVPHLIQLQAELPPEGGDVAELPMVLELVQIIYVPYAAVGLTESQRLGEYPHYYLRGVVHRNSYDPRLEGVRVNVYIDADTPEDIASIYIQVVPRPSDCDPATPLCWADGPPAELADRNLAQ
jgi:hypothetical protein